jgi:hypothetical protein
LEETRERKIDHYARVIQKAFQRYFNKQKFLKQKEQAAGKPCFLVLNLSTSYDLE